MGRFPKPIIFSIFCILTLGFKAFSAPPICSESNMQYRFVDTEDARSYYFCDAALEAVRRCCPANLHFNILTLDCDWPENANNPAPVTDRCDRYEVGGHCNPSAWQNYQTGSVYRYQQKWDNYSCRCVIDSSKPTEYECKAGYFGNGTKCTKCPDHLDIFGGSHPKTSKQGSTSEDQCYLIGTYEPACPYNENPVTDIRVAAKDDARAWYHCDYFRGYQETTHDENGNLVILTNGYPLKKCCPPALHFKAETMDCDWPVNANNPAPVPSGDCVPSEMGCENGYYGTPQTGCQLCPDNFGVPGVSYKGANFHITSCKIPSRSPVTDSKGSWVYQYDCYYK